MKMVLKSGLMSFWNDFVPCSFGEKSSVRNQHTWGFLFVVRPIHKWCLQEVFFRFWWSCVGFVKCTQWRELCQCLCIVTVYHYSVFVDKRILTAFDPGLFLFSRQWKCLAWIFDTHKKCLQIKGRWPIEKITHSFFFWIQLHHNNCHCFDLSWNKIVLPPKYLSSIGSNKWKTNFRCSTRLELRKKVSNPNIWM